MRKVLVLLFCLTLPVASHAQGSITGVVKDATGAVVSGAAVIIRTSSGLEQHAVTDPKGRFELARPVPSGATLVIRAGGFAEKTQPLSDTSGQIEIVLEPAKLFDEVTVTPTRTEQRLGDIPRSEERR